MEQMCTRRENRNTTPFDATILRRELRPSRSDSVVWDGKLKRNVCAALHLWPSPHSFPVPRLLPRLSESGWSGETNKKCVDNAKEV